MEKLLRRAVEFHGHMGGFLVIGLRMGLLAKKILKPKGYQDMFAELETDTKLPFSCLIDGVQVASLCTFGKGNISVKDSKNIIGTFYLKDGRTVKVKVKPSFLKKNKEELLKDPSNMAVKVLEIPDEDLFIVTKSDVRKP